MEGFYYDDYYFYNMLLSLDIEKQFIIRIA